MHDEAHYDDQWETIRTILFEEIKIKCPGLQNYLTIQDLLGYCSFSLGTIQLRRQHFLGRKLVKFANGL